MTMSFDALEHLYRIRGKEIRRLEIDNEGLRRLCRVYTELLDERKEELESLYALLY